MYDLVRMCLILMGRLIWVFGISFDLLALFQIDSLWSTPKLHLQLKIKQLLSTKVTQLRLGSNPREYMELYLFVAWKIAKFKK